jgi:hypothetical protein
MLARVALPREAARPERVEALDDPADRTRIRLVRPEVPRRRGTWIGVQSLLSLIHN